MSKDAMGQAVPRDSLGRLKERGQDELARLYILQRPALRQMIAAQLHSRFRRRLDASDIVQEGYVRARRLLASYLKDPKIPPVVWLRILCKQVLAENIRKQKRRKRDPGMEVVLGSGAQMLAELASSWVNQPDQLSKRESIAQIRQIMSKLKEADREIIEMRHSEGYSFREIADQLEIRMETAKKRYYRAINRFRELLGPDFEA